MKDYRAMFHGVEVVEGDRIGELELVSVHKDGHGRMRWRCSCGRTVLRKLDGLTSTSTCKACAQQRQRLGGKAVGSMIIREYTPEEEQMIKEYYERVNVSKEDNRQNKK